MSVLSACPPRAAARITSALVAACRRHRLAVHLAHPRVVDHAWRASGHRLGTAIASIERVARDAAARGYSSLDLGTVANRRA